ncbi:MAG: hypothetical protein ACRDOL_25410 [Streptosporangiaceae bacterium]
MTAAPPGDLAAIVFQALCRDFGLITAGVLHIVVPKGAPLLAGDSLGEIARRISAASAPAADPLQPGQPRQTGTSP